jgi:Ca-activated chloride channel family protein
MRGTRIQTLVDGVKQAIEKMTPQDRYRIVAFSSTARDITGGYKNATPENIQKTVEKLLSLKAGGRTDLYAGMLSAYKKLDEDRTTGVILITDGVVKVNSQQHNKFLQLLEEYDVRIFSFVIGNAGDQGLMERLAKDSGGFTMNISDSDDVIGRIMQAKTHLLFENMHNVQLKIDGTKVQDITPQVIGNLYHGQQLVMFGRYDKPGNVQIELKARISGEDRSWTCDAVLPRIDTDNPELERLWALSTIEDISQIMRDEGETSNLRSEIIKLGTEYSLVTDYTSMLVIMEQRFKDLNIDRKNQRRVQTERQAQEKRKAQPVKSYRVDKNKTNPSGNKGAFDGKRSPGFGSGPVGPAFIAMALWLKKRKKTVPAASDKKGS